MHRETVVSFRQFYFDIKVVRSLTWSTLTIVLLPVLVNPIRFMLFTFSLFSVILILHSNTALHKYVLENTTNMKDTSCITMKNWVWWLIQKKKTSNKKISKFYYYYNERQECY